MSILWAKSELQPVSFARTQCARRTLDVVWLHFFLLLVLSGLPLAAQFRGILEEGQFGVGHIDLDFYLLDGSAFDRYGDHHVPLAYVVLFSRRKLDVHLNHFTLLHLHHFLSFD